MVRKRFEERFAVERMVDEYEGLYTAALGRQDRIAAAFIA
jgi:hypothetical protein